MFRLQFGFATLGWQSLYTKLSFPTAGQAAIVRLLLSTSFSFLRLRMLSTNLLPFLKVTSFSQYCLVSTPSTPSFLVFAFELALVLFFPCVPSKFLTFQNNPVVATEQIIAYASQVADGRHRKPVLPFNTSAVCAKEGSDVGQYSPQHSQGSLSLIIRLLQIEMEKEVKQATSGNPLVKVHACFEELETLRFLNFLQHKEGKLIYKGVTEQQNRKSKDFFFNSISLLTDKLKHTHQEVIREVAQALLRGESRSIIIFGNDQTKKEKLMIGESQNAGILLLIVSQLFNICYDRQIEDKVTIKLACWQQAEGQKCDGFGVHTTLTVQEDLIEGKILIGNPEVIVRNMKSALKIIKLFMRRAEEVRELKQDATETFLISLKLEIDNGYDKQGNVTEYKLSKLHMVKLANPFSAKAKHPQWFISLFNHFQADALEKMRSQEQQTDDDTVSYIKECVIRSVHGIHCFSCFGNKMTANECLTTLKFSSYLQYAKLAPQKMIINLPEMKKEHLVLESQLMKTEEEKQVWFQGTKQFDWLKLEDSLASQQLQEILALNIKGLELGNILEYQYAVVLTNACDKLEKYIFNEEVQDYFYAKKTNPQITTQLKQAVARFLETRKKSYQLQHKLIQRATTAANRLRKESSESRGVKYLLNSKIKEKQLYEKIFMIYNTEVAHFLYQENEEIIEKLQKYSQTQLLPIQNEAPQIATAELSNFSIQMLQKSRQVQLASQAPCRVDAKRKKAVDELQMMFTNSNANLCGRRLKN